MSRWRQAVCWAGLSARPARAHTRGRVSPPMCCVGVQRAASKEEAGWSTNRGEGAGIGGGGEARPGGRDGDQGSGREARPHLPSPLLPHEAPPTKPKSTNKTRGQLAVDSFPHPAVPADTARPRSPPPAARGRRREGRRDAGERRRGGGGGEGGEGAAVARAVPGPGRGGDPVYRARSCIVSLEHTFVHLPVCLSSVAAGQGWARSSDVMSVLVSGALFYAMTDTICQGFPDSTCLSLVWLEGCHTLSLFLSFLGTSAQPAHRHSATASRYYACSGSPISNMLKPTMSWPPPP